MRLKYTDQDLEIMTWTEVSCLNDWATEVPHITGFFFNLKKKKCLFIFEREGDTQSEAHSKLWIDSTEQDMWLELTNYEIMT